MKKFLNKNHQIMTKFLSYLIMSLFLFQSYANSTINSTIAYKYENEVWEDFRQKYPFHLQTIGITEIQEDQSFQLIISEPPPHVTKSELNNFFTGYDFSMDVKKHPLGIDGWVKDVSVVLNNVNLDQVEALIESLSKLLFHSSYKAHTLDLSKTPSNLIKERINYQISAAEIEDWLITKSEKFYEIDESDYEYSVNELLANEIEGIFYSSVPGLVIWVISHDDICYAEKQARQFAIDSDMVIGAISGYYNTAIIGRERELPIHKYPPLRTETIMMLANANDNELAQSYERNQMFAGKLDNGKDWAPIYLSDELKHTEFGSLLNITDQLLKSWSENGETDYENFGYTFPIDWPFEKPLSSMLSTSSVTFNWNTRGATYLIEYDDYSIRALNRTGALPVSYFPGGEVDSIAEIDARKLEKIGYNYFSEQNDPNLFRVKQYTALYQIFSNLGIECNSIEKYNISEYKDNSVEQELQKEALSILEKLSTINVDSVSKKYIENYYKYLSKIGIVENSLIKDSLVDIIKEEFEFLKEFKTQIEEEYGTEGLELFSSIIANPRDTELHDSYEVDEVSSTVIFLTSIVFQELFNHLKVPNLKYLGASFEDVSNKLIKANKRSHRNWFKTPTIVISRNLDYLERIGGHNLNSSLVEFVVDNTVSPGYYKTTTLYGQKYIAVSKQDINKINSSFLRNAHYTEDGLVKFASNTTIPIESRFAKNFTSQSNTESKKIRGLNINFNSSKKVDFVVSKNNYKYKIKEIEDEVLLQYPTNENILFPIKNLDEIEAIVNNMKSRKYISEEIETISFVDNDTKTVETIGKHFGQQSVEHQIMDVSDLKKVFQQNNMKSYALIGHIEDGHFAFKNGNQRISIDKILEAAEEANVNVFPFGCKSSFSKKIMHSGLATNINSIQLANSFSSALKYNNNIWDMFSKLANDGFEIILTDEPFTNLGYLDAKLKGKRVVGTITTTSATGVGFILGLILAPCEDCDEAPCEDFNKNGICDEDEPYEDLNNNGIWDDDEPCKDINNNCICDEEEPCDDLNKNCVCDKDE